VGVMGTRVDYKSLGKFRDSMSKLNMEQARQFSEAAVKGLAARLLAAAAKRTPVGQYPAGSGKTGGTLRRHWAVSSVKNSGGDCSIYVFNPTEYAAYVEFGHRTRGHKGWVGGRFMLTVSELELKRDSPRILQNKLKKFLEGFVNAK
jgi:hypothetical protein